MATERNIQYEVKRPAKVRGAGKRAAFSIQKVVYAEDGGRSQSTVTDERIDAINSHFLAQDLTFQQAETLIKEIHNSLRASLIKPGRIVHNEENRNLLKKFWDEDYQYRDNKSPETMGYELKNALELIGHISLLSVGQEALQQHINSLPLPNNKQRRLVDRVQMLLKHAGRRVILKKKKKEPRIVSHLTKDDLTAVVKLIPDQVMKLATVIAFESGVRVGELFGLKKEQCRGNQVYVARQLTRKRGYDDTKTGRERFLYCTNEGAKALQEWFLIPETERNTFRKKNHSEIVKKACKTAFPSDESKWVDFHSMRHSYAINLVSRGVSISLVAQSLGNSVSVCQEYYSGYSLTAESVASIKNILGE